MLEGKYFVRQWKTLADVSAGTEMKGHDVGRSEGGKGLLQA